MTISKKAVLVGLIGTNLQFSRAPEIHMREGELSGLRYIYRLIDMAALGLDLKGLPLLLVSAQQLGFNGLAVTHPFKESIIPHLAAVSDDAARLGAVNTVVFTNGQSVGHNTDGLGFAASFQRDMAQVKTDRVIQLGAGGAGKAVAHALLSSGVKHLALSVRNPEKAQPMLASLASTHGAPRVSIVKNLPDEIANADGVVNATPIGMDAYPGIPLARSFLRPDLWIVDLIYSPSETELLKAARAVGARANNGTGMFVFQAAEQFRLFSGVQPNVERMETHILQILASRKS